MGDIVTTLVLSLAGLVSLAMLLRPAFVRQGWPLELLAALTVFAAMLVTLQIISSKQDAETRQRESQEQLISKVDDLRRALSVGLHLPLDPTEPPLLPSARAVELAGLIKPNDGPYALALKATAERRFDDARNLFARAEEDTNIDPRALYAARADMEAYAGNYAEQIEWLQKGLALAPNDSDLLLKKGVASMAQHRFDEAKAPLQQAAVSREHATAALAQTDLACAYLQQGRVSEAKNLNDQALAAVPNAGDPYRAVVLTNAAGIAEMEDAQRAKELYLQALQLESETCPEGAMRADTLNGLGWLYERMGNPKAAEEALESSVMLGENCLKEGPRLAELLISLGKLYTDRKRYNHAEPLFKHALLLTESAAAGIQRVTVLKAYRDFLDRAGRIDEAASVQRQVVAIEGNAPFRGVPLLLPTPPESSGDTAS